MLNRRAFSILLAGAPFAAATKRAQAAKYQWNLANDYPENTLPAIGDKFFSETLEEESSGDLRVNVFLNGSLGFSSAQMLDAIGTGALEMGNAAIGFYGGSDPLFFATTMPFLAATPADVQRIFTNGRKIYDEALEKFDHRVLYATPWTPVGIWAKRPIVSAEDVKGLRIRVADKFAGKLFADLGAHPIQLNWGDVPSQLATGAIDSVLTAADGGLGSNIDEFLKFFTDIKYNNSFNLASMNLDIYRSLDPSLQAALSSSAKITQAHQWQLAQNQVEISRDVFKQRGVEEVSEISNELRATFNARRENIIAEWLSTTGPRGIALLKAYDRT